MLHSLMLRNDFAGCITGLQKFLRRHGLFEGIWTLDEKESLSPARKKNRQVYSAYPDLNDDAIIAENLDTWLIIDHC
jgi:hypothetical protein